MNANNHDPSSSRDRRPSFSDLLRPGDGLGSDLFRAFADTIPALISYIDVERRYQFINEKYENWFGVDRDQTLGKSISEVLGREAQEKVEPYLKRVFSGEEMQFEAHIHYPKAGWKWVQSHYIPDFAKDGTVRGFFALVVDITARKELEARSREQFEELENIYASVPVGLAVIDRDLRYVRVNEWLAQINGLPAREHVGKTIREVVPAIADQAERALRKVLETGEPLRDVILEGETAAQPSVPRAWSEIWTPVKNESGEMLAVSVVVEDVTERRWAEELLNEQNRLLEMIAAGRPLAEVLNEITAVVGKLEPRTRAAILITNADRTEFVGACAANIPDTYTIPLVGVKIEQVPIGTCCKAVYCGEPVTSTDVATDDRWTDTWRELCLAHGIAACHSEPIFGEDERPLGTLVLGFDTPREPDARALRIAAFGSHVAGIAIDRSRAEQALAASENKYRVLFDSMDEGYCIIEVIFDDDGRPVDYLFVEVNSAFERQAGMSDVVGRRMLEFVPAIERHWLDNYGSVARTGTPIRFANEYKGLNKWFDVYAFRPEGWEGTRIAVLFTDITERKRAEGEIASAAARDEYRIHLADTIRGIPDPEDVKKEAARLLGERLGVNRALYAEVQGDDWILVKGFESGVEPMPDGAYSAQDFGYWVMETYRRGERIVFRDTQNDPRLAPGEREAHVSASILGAVGVPLVKAGELVAVLAVHTASPRDWSEDEIALVDETAERTWDAVERVRAESALRSAHNTFRQLVDDSPFGIYVVDADFKLARVSSGAQKVFENVRPLLGRDFAEVMRVVWEEPFASEAVEIFRHTLETGKTYHSPRTIETRGDIGEIESYDWKLERITMPDGRYGVVCHFYDLSERIRFETALVESEQRFRNMADNAPVMVWVTEPDGTCSFLSQTWYAFTGQTPETGLGFGWLDAVHPEDRERSAQFFESANRKGEAFRVEYRLRRKDGEYRWAIDSAQPRVAANGEFLGFIGSVIDITERRRAEEALRETEQRFRSTFEQAAVGIAHVSLDGRWTMVNERLCEITGYSRGELLGRTFQEITHPDDLNADLGNLNRLLAGEIERYTMNKRYVRKDGEHVWVDLTVSLIRKLDGAPKYFISVVEDITTRKQAEEALRENETRHRLALEAGGMGTWTMPLDGRRGWADERTLALFDVPADQWKGDISALHSRRFAEDVEANSQTATDGEGRTTWRSEFRVRHRDGSIKWIAGIARVEFGSDGAPRLMRGIYFDITERKQAEEELRRHRETLEETVRERTAELAAAVSELQYENRQRKIVEEERQKLLARLVAAQEEERRRIAQDLHDQLGQQLTALNMKLDLALRSAAADDGPGHLSDARAMLRRIDDDVDALAWELRPAMLDDDGFIPALRRYVEDWSGRYHVPAEFWADDGVSSPGFLSSEAETNLYRITQEALNNIAKYADATGVEVLLKRRGDAVVLLIQDDGAGFDVAEFGRTKLKTMGLVGMRERAGLVGGTFQIESAPGEGTTVYVQVPLAPAEEDSAGLMQTAGS